METSSAFPLAAASQACMEAFHHLLTSLSAPNESSKGNLQLHVVNNQRARFKIWATNLGALQSGRASLDFRLMETSLTQATILKFLNGLKVTLSKSTEIVRGLRAPIEQIIPDNSDQGFNCSGDSSGSENDSSDDENNTKTELGHNTAEIDHVISSLMRVSFRIKGPGSRTTQLNQKAMAHEELINVDGPAAEDIFLIYSDYDRQYVEEFFRQLRRVNAEMELHLFDGDTESTGPSEEKQQELTNDLVERWAKSITSRRRILAYWRRHARKLAKEEPSTAHTVVPTTAAEAVFPLRPAQSLMQSYAKQSTLQSTLSGTEAKRNVQEVNDIDTVSTVSYSSTTLDESSSTGLPAPPSITPGQTKITRYPLGMEMTVITPSGRVVALEEFVSIELEARWLSDCDLGTCHISAVPDHVLGTFDAEFLAGKKIIAKLQGKGYVARETSVSVRMIAGLETLNADSRGAQTNKKRNQTFFDWLEEEEKAPETHVEEECYSGSCTTIDKITGVPKLDVPYRAEAACSRCT
ncbi:ankyrin repeat protein [Colletotrichum truncatum]|uniref:Ankyrin repeat protein n=1 Tax=Colletotrichum truncatum TaxID=5467 RepID=A0ACC3ZEK8_COLTU